MPVADKNGYFAKHGLQVELINFGGSTDQLLEAIATGKADAGVGMALRWLKPLEQGFDVKITTAVHGGCMRLFTNSASGIKDISGLRGKTVGVSDLAAPDKNFFSIVAAKQGIDPTKDIEWRAYPADMLGVALQRGEIQVVSLGDPMGWILRDRDHLTEIANNLDGEYAHMACCVLGVRGSLIRNDRAAAVALTAALSDAQNFVAANPSVFCENRRIELIEGEIFEMAAIGGRHIGAIMALTELFAPAALGRFRVSIQNSLWLEDHSEPEPDVVLLRQRADKYVTDQPSLAADADLLLKSLTAA